jgi:hypothetical protein
MSNLILREFNGYQIRQREDGYVSLTDMAQATGKRFHDWHRLDSTQDLISVLSHNNGISRDILITSKSYQGTYGHPKVAIAFATWCSPEFFSTVIDWTQDIITKGYAIIENTSSEQLEASKAEIESLLEKKGKLKEINKDTADVNFKMQFIIPKLIQKILDVEGGLVMMKRDKLPCGFWKKEKKDLFSFLRELKQEMQSCFGDALLPVKTTEQLKMSLSEEKFDKLCQIVLDTSWDEYWQGYRNPEWDMSESDRV